ncbi:MAG: dihydroorotate dehydrogenase electron transfer subunit [Lachnospiraceae bacterium]|nr:dihydroorotate dehydrogenase electron transfer subunit [Lachnospiraceae bacterium]
MQIFEKSTLVKCGRLSDGIYEMYLKTGAAEYAKPGQFVMVYPANASTILPRPISICEVCEDTLRLVYRVQGKGTREFSLYKEGESVKVLGPIGNGFPVEEGHGKKSILIGGGIGVPPILELAKALKGEDTTILAGYRNSDMFLNEDFKKQAPLEIATEDGSVGVKGNVMDVIREKNLKCDVIFACGPMPMLRAIKKYAEETGIKAYISLEERMACGVGACLGCVCKTTKKDEHSHVNNARVCTEGPVFEAREVEI